MKLTKPPLLFLAAVLPIAAQIHLPATPAAGQFAAWLSAFNRDDPAILREFLSQSSPRMAENVERWIDMRAQTGGFDLKKTGQSSDMQLEGIVKERDSDRYARFSIEGAAEVPHRIERLSFRLIPRPPEFPPVARLSETQAMAAFAAVLNRQCAAGRFSGAVMVAKNGTPIFESACGFANRERKISNRLDTKFRVGSMNKMFTAVAIGQLAQQGKIKLNDPVGKYLTEYPNPEIASRVTIHHLLTHTGGTGDIFGPDFDKNRLTLKELTDYVKLYGARGPEFEPGGKWAYSNYGFILLGAIVEKVSGQSYYDYVRRNIFLPTGMSSTDSSPENEEVRARSVGYTRMGGGALPRRNTDALPYRGTSAGGGYSTVHDLIRFADALTGQKLMNAEYTELFTTGKAAAGAGKYAYGFFDVTEEGVRYFGHGGGAPGMNGDLRIFPDSRYVVAVLSNLDPPAATRVADYIGARLPAVHAK